MIQLNELSKIVSGKAERDEQERLEREQKYNEKQEREYQEVIENLEQRLKKAALDGKKKLIVAKFSAFNGGNVSDRLHKKIGSHRSYYASWNEVIFESDVIENMQGNLKRVYDYLKINNLYPKVGYWLYKSGRDEGFSLVVKW